MKFKTTRKAIVNGCNNIRSAGYCELSSLLVNHEPLAYTAGVYGWNFDVYEVYGLTICTGYRGMPGITLKGSAEAEKAAYNIRTNGSYSTWEADREKIENILIDFCIMNGGAIYG